MTRPTHDSPQPRDTDAEPARTAPPDAIHQSFGVAFDYPVHFTRDVFGDGDLLGDVLDRRKEARRHRTMVYVDDGVAKAHPRLAGRIREYFHARPERMELAAPPEIVPGGERAKNGWDVVRDVMWTLGNLHLDRQSFVIAVGGGAMLDMIGFAASIVHRGVRLVRLPTTTLAQNDAGVGVKNGMDEHGMKNFVGTFAPPFAVVNDLDFLPTLADRDWIGGAAEAFKVAIIRDAAFFDTLSRDADALRTRNMDAMERLVRRCAALHLEHIRTSGDPFEFGSARPLDFGHWAAHKLETMSGYRIAHGQAVSIGIAIDSVCAAEAGLLNDDELERILGGMTACGLPVWSSEVQQRDADGELCILAGLADFREHLGGALTVTLPDGIGRSIEVHHVSPDAVERATVRLRERACDRR